MIRFSMDDFSTTPSPAYPGKTVNDTAITRGQIMKAYEAVAYLNVYHDAGSTSTGDIHEYTGSADDIFLSLNHSQLTADDDNEVKQFGPSGIGEYAKARWRLDTDPDTASLSSSGELKVNIEADASGQLKGSVWDEDVDLSGDAINVVSSATGGWSALVNVILSTNSIEGLSGLGFAFSSDILGDQSTTKIELASGDYVLGLFDSPHEETADYSFSNSLDFLGGQGDMTDAKAIIKGSARCDEETPEPLSLHASATIQSQGGSGTGGVTYSIGVPTYVPGSGLTSNPDW